MTIDRPLRLFSLVDSAADALLAGLEGNSHNFELARKVSSVFKEYERRLRELVLALDGAGLTNTEQ